jgi:hypothetical protein
MLWGQGPHLIFTVQIIQNKFPTVMLLPFYKLHVLITTIAYFRGAKA